MDSSEWDERYAGTELVWTAEPNRFVVEGLQALPPGRALDVGAGEGRNAIWLAHRGWQVTAVDFSAVGLEQGRAGEQPRGRRAGCTLICASTSLTRALSTWCSWLTCSFARWTWTACCAALRRHSRRAVCS